MGLKTSLGSLRFSLGMVTEFASRPPWRLVSIDIGGFRYTRGTGQRSSIRKPVKFFFTLDLIPNNACQECVVTMLTICLFSGLRSSLLCLDNKVCADTNLCWRYACFSSTSEGIGNIISVNKLGGLPDLLCQPCQREMNA